MKVIMPRPRAMFCLGTVLALALTTAAHAQTLVPEQKPVPKEYFGMHIHKLVRPHRDGTRTVIPQIGLGAWRLSDGAKWSDFNPSQSLWNFGLLDLYANIAAQHGWSVHLNIGVTPRWASSRPSELGEWGYGTAAEPADMETWKSYVRELATRFKGRIHAYEIWNEPKYSDLERTVANDGRALGSYTGTSAKMVEMTKLAYLIIKSASPGAIVVSPSPTGYTDDRVNLFLARGGGKFVDAMAFHFYPRSPERDLLPRVAMIRKAMKDYGVGNLPLWNTESGFIISGLEPIDPAQFPDTRIFTPAEAAPVVARSLILGWAAGLSRYYFYAWDDGKYGLTSDWTTGEPNLAGQAFEQTRRWLQGSVLKSCVGKSDIWNCEIQRAEPFLQGRIVWTTDASANLVLRPEWEITKVETLAGDVMPAGSSVKLTESPMLLIRAGE
ncbi:endo-1,4-beta-xylanase [Thauera sinica]|uniref:Endo-1,4-beta-xylanase n=1 Tax=Thauera sinica TaxID=2665146 RepID=A0ABW1ANJ6_9RHOO